MEAWLIFCFWSSFQKLSSGLLYKSDCDKTAVYIRLYTVLCYFGNKDIKSCQLSFLYLRWKCSPQQARPKNDDHTTTSRKKKFLLRNLPANNGSIFFLHNGCAAEKELMETIYGGNFRVFFAALELLLWWQLDSDNIRHCFH